MPFNFTTIYVIDLSLFGIIVIIIIFIFLRRIFTFPYRLICSKRINLYADIINNLNSLYKRNNKYEGGYRIGKNILNIKSRMVKSHSKK